MRNYLILGISVLLLVSMVFGLSAQFSLEYISDTIDRVSLLLEPFANLAGLSGMPKVFYVPCVENTCGKYVDTSGNEIDIALYLKEKLIPYGAYDNSNYNINLYVSTNIYYIDVVGYWQNRYATNYFSTVHGYEENFFNGYCIPLKLVITPKSALHEELAYHYVYYISNTNNFYVCYLEGKNVCQIDTSLNPFALYENYEYSYYRLIDGDYLTPDKIENYPTNLPSASISFSPKFVGFSISAFDRHTDTIETLFPLVYERNGSSNYQ